MVTAINEVEKEGVVTRDELLAMGCEEVKSQKGRKAYELDGKVVAIACTRCEKVKMEGCFTRINKGFMNLLSGCKKCMRNEQQKRRKERPETTHYYRNRERLLSERRESYAKNSGSIREWRRCSHNRKRDNLNKRIAYGENKQIHKTRVADWARRNPEIVLLSRLRRRALQHVLLADLTAEQLAQINATFYNTCALSGEPSDLHADHILPISIGHGGTTYGNMIPLSAELNQSKSNAHIFEWFEANRERFRLSQDKFDALIEYLADTNEMTTQEYRKYVDWCFDNPRVICETTGELVFKDGPINERMTQIYEGASA